MHRHRALHGELVLKRVFRPARAIGVARRTANDARGAALAVASGPTNRETLAPRAPVRECQRPRVESVHADRVRHLARGRHRVFARCEFL